MNERYVDDINMAVEATEPGLRYKEGKVFMDETSVAEDQRTSADARTMNIIKQVGNDIHPSIKLEIDYPSKHQDGKLPIPDLKVWVESRERDVEGQKKRVSVILYEFYSKRVSSKSVINARSALSWSTKRTVLTQEVLRVLLNCSKHIPRESVNKKVQEMVLRMQYSGYSKKFRYEVVDSALKAYRIRQVEEERGVRPMHRPKEWKKNKREEERVRKNNWYKKGGDESVIFVPATPSSELQRKYQQEIKRQGFAIKVVEKSGVTIKELLQRSDPCKPPGCDRGNCMVCQTEGKGKCNRQGVTYEISCNTCGDRYIGETARSAYTRGVEHKEALENRERRNRPCGNTAKKNIRGKFRCSG